MSKNLNIGFDCLKADMVGQAPPDANACPSGTGSGKMSIGIGKAISSMQPNADAKAEAKKATSKRTKI